MFVELKSNITQVSQQADKLKAKISDNKTMINFNIAEIIRVKNLQRAQCTIISRTLSSSFVDNATIRHIFVLQSRLDFQALLLDQPDLYFDKFILFLENRVVFLQTHLHSTPKEKGNS